MNLRNKSFPYPLLDATDFSRDDYIDGRFVADIDLSDLGNAQIRVSARYSCNVGELCDLVSSGYAMYCLVIACPQTFMQRAFLTTDLIHDIDLSSDSLYGQVKLIPQIVAVREVLNYGSKSLNEEYGQASFHLEEGDVLAVAQTESWFFEFAPMSLKSLFEVHKTESLPPYAYSVGTDSDRLVIKMGSKLRHLWDQIRYSPDYKSLLMMSIYKDSLMIALDDLSRNEEDALQYMWARSLTTKLGDLGVSELMEGDIDQINVIAQQIFEEFSVKRLYRQIESE